jgi:spore coat protein U-like protein
MTKHTRFTSNGFRLAALVLAIAGPGSAMAASAVASSTSTVIAAIDIQKTSDLAFGSFAASGTSGSVTVTPGSTRTAGGGVTVVGTTASAAKFDVTGQAGLGYSIGVVATTLDDGSGNSMTLTPISDLAASANTSGTVDAGTLTGGAQSFYVGGVLNVAANQAAGNYSGTVTATVNYN